MSLLLATAMMVGMLSSMGVSADFTQNPVINLFNTFQGYEKEAGVHVDEENVFSPNGLRPYSNLYNMSSEIDSNDDTAIKLNTGAQMALPFDEVISKGYLHISFDMKLPETVNGTFNVLLRQNLLSDSPVDIYNSYSETYQAWTEAVDGNLLAISSEGVASKTNTYFWAGKNNVQNISLGDWHKYDFFFDFEAETPQIVSYIDGISIGITGFQEQVTGFAQMVFEPGFDNIYIDNVYAKHYLNAADNGVAMSLDFASDGVAQNDGLLNIAFSEPLGYIEVPGFSPYAEGDSSYDFYAVNQATGTAYYARSGAVTDRGLQLTFGNLPAGYYSLKVNEASAYDPEEAGDCYIGKITGKKIAGDATFYVKGDEKNNTNRRYYLNEDFNGYTGGMPLGTTSISYKNEYSVLESGIGKNGADDASFKSLATHTGEGVVFKFPNAIQDGKIYVEFDIKTSEASRWGVGIVETADAAPTNFIQDTQYAAVTGTDDSGAYKASKDSYQKKEYNRVLELAKTAAGDSFDQATWDAETWPGLWHAYLKEDGSEGIRKWHKQGSRDSGMLVGNYTVNTTRDNTLLGYTNASKTSNSVPKTDTGLDIPVGQWTTVKVVVNMEAENYTITVGDNSFTTPEWNDARYTKRTMIDTKTGKKVYFSGIQGLVIKSAAAATEFDNVKVYTDNSYNTFNDFDGFTTGLNKYHGWILPTNPVRDMNTTETAALPWNTYMLAANGTKGVNNSTDANDRALQLRSYSNQVQAANHLFNIPVKAGKAFDVEFDIMAAAATSQTFSMMLSDAYDLYTKTNNVYKGEKVWEDFDANTGTVQTSYTGCHYDNVCLFSEGTKFYLASGATATWTTTASSVSAAVTGNGANIPFEAAKWHHVKFSYIPKADGVYFKLNVDGTESTEYKSSKSLTEEIAVIGFRANNISIDNLKISEAGTVNNAYITDAYVVGLNGVKRAFDGTFTNADEYVELISSATLLNTDEIGVYDGSTNKTVSVTKQLSADRKTVKLYLSSLAVGKSYTVYVNPEQKFESSSYIALMEPFRKKVTIGTTESSVVFESLRLCQDYGTKTVRKNGQIVEMNLGKAPLASSVLKDKTDADLYLVAKGYNTGAATTVNLIGSNMIAERFSGAVLDAVEIPSGRFAVEIPVNITDTQNIFKGFLWSNNLKPLIPAVEYSVVNTVVE